MLEFRTVSYHQSVYLCEIGQQMIDRMIQSPRPSIPSLIGRLY